MTRGFGRLVGGGKKRKGKEKAKFVTQNDVQASIGSECFVEYFFGAFSWQWRPFMRRLDRLAFR